MNDISKSRQSTKWILMYVLWGLVTCVTTLILLVAIHRPSLKVIQQWKQPASITYDHMGPYYLSIVEDDLNWRSFPLNVERNYFIYVGHNAGTPDHGHMIRYSFSPPADLKPFLAAAQVQWTAQGVELLLPSGHRLFIPKAMFTGGR